MVMSGRRNRKKAVGFFHPHTNDGGGGERVLWCAVKAIQEEAPELKCVIYTGDDASPQSLEDRALHRFGIKLLQPPQLFKDLEMYNRKPPDKAVVKKVADAYELLGLQEEQEKLLQKYGSLFKSSSSTTGKGKQESSSNSHKESKPPFGNAPKNYDAGNDSIATAKTMPTLGSCSTTT